MTSSPNTRTLTPSRYLQGLYAIAMLLRHDEKPVTQLRRRLIELDYSSNQISLIFDALRQERVPGIKVTVRIENGAAYWKMTGQIGPS